MKKIFVLPYLHACFCEMLCNVTSSLMNKGGWISYRSELCTKLDKGKFCIVLIVNSSNGKIN